MLRQLKASKRLSLRNATKMGCLTSETVQSATLALEGVDDIERSDGLALGVLSVGDSIANDVFEEDLEDTTGLLVNKARDTLDTTTTSETTDSGLRDTLDVVTKNFAMTLCASLSESFSSFSTASHVE